MCNALSSADLERSPSLLRLQFLKELDLSVASLKNGLIAAIDDRVLTVSAMDSVFHLPPGGRAAYGDFPVRRENGHRTVARPFAALS